MPRSSSKASKKKKYKEKYYFFPNPYEDCAFTKCPKCETKTKVRKFILLISIEHNQLFLLNKKCKFCTNCELIIAKKKEIESLMAAGLLQVNPKVIGNDYLTIGTIDRKDWKAANEQSLTSAEIIDKAYLFKDQWDFKVIPAGWYRDE
jgi:hypothetical protein